MTRISLIAVLCALVLLIGLSSAAPARDRRGELQRRAAKAKTSTTSFTRSSTLSRTPTATRTSTTRTQTPTTTATPTPTPIPLTSDDYLHVEGALLKTRLGKTVQLKGVNIGGWLVTEAWMNGQVDSYMNGRAALEQLEVRFGVSQAATLMKAWQDNWFTSYDLDIIRSWGFNCIRVPFSWRNLQDANGNWTLKPDGSIDFGKLDWVVQEAGKRGIYVVLDFHYWPRQQESGNYGLPSRWTTDGGIVRSQMAAIWTEVAKHFKGNGAIAGFDVINEPEGSPWNAPHHAGQDAIMAQDPERVVIFEWSGYNNTFPEFAAGGNKSVMYSDHYEFNDQASFDGYKASIDAGPVKVPLFLGEMKPGADTTAGAKWLADTMDTAGYHWCIWTYKGVSIGGWAAFDYYTQLRYNLTSDSFDSILDKWTNGISSWYRNSSAPVNSYWNQWWIDGFRRN